MSRILEIIEYLKENSLDRNVRLVVKDENGQPLQGYISVEQLDDIVCKLKSPKDEDCCVAEETPPPRYFVYNPDHDGKPKKIYNDYLQAFADAQDIAKKYNECNIYVLEIISEIQKKCHVHEIITENGKKTGESSYECEVPF